MLRTIRRLNARSLANTNRHGMDNCLDNITRLVEEIRALPQGASAQELAGRLLAEAEDVEIRARNVDEFTAKASA